MFFIELDDNSLLVEANLEEIKSEYATLCTLVLCMLMQKNIDISTFRTFLAARYLPNGTKEIDSRDNNLNRFVSEVLDSAKDLGEIFQLLMENGLLSYRNFHILRSIIKCFASDDIKMKSDIDEYEGRLVGYDMVIIIKDHLKDEVEQCKQPRPDPKLPDSLVDKVKVYVTEKILKSISEFWQSLVYHEQSEPDPALLDKLSIKVKARVTEKTLKYVDELWESLAYQIKLPPTALLFHKIAKGCLEITWLLPFHLTHFTTRRLQESTDYFRERNILLVTIAGRYIYEELPSVQEGARMEETGEKVYRIAGNFREVQIFAIFATHDQNANIKTAKYETAKI